MNDSVLTLHDINPDLISTLLHPYKVEMVVLQGDKTIPGSYWGESEAGLIKNKLYVRSDTPIHSILHEACHYICMDDTRRSGLQTDAGGDYDEENAVCYLQILLAGELGMVGYQRMMQDMDSWGYTFRLGSAGQWFQHDAEEAKQWLINNAIINENLQPTLNLNH